MFGISTNTILLGTGVLSGNAQTLYINNAPTAGSSAAAAVAGITGLSITGSSSITGLISVTGIDGFQVNQLGNNLRFDPNGIVWGPLEFETNAGQVSLIDLPITTGAGSGIEQSYVLQIGGQPVLKIYTECNTGITGSLTLQNTRIQFGTLATDRINFYAGFSGTAPSTNTLTVPATISTYGGTGKLLGTPDMFLDILVSGLPYKLPLFA